MKVSTNEGGDRTQRNEGEVATMKGLIYRNYKQTACSRRFAHKINKVGSWLFL